MVPPPSCLFSGEQNEQAIICRNDMISIFLKSLIIHEENSNEINI